MPLREPVIEAARLAHEAAARLCRVDPGTGESCAWYHGFRMYLRALGLAITPGHHADFYRSAVEAMADGHRRLNVLVSGAIDFSMAAHVFWAAETCGVEVDVTVLDICETPLYLNRWYAERIGVPITLTRASILDYRPDRRFDLVCTNSFLGQFAPQERPKLVRCWHALLSAGGRVVTVTPVRPGADVGMVGFSDGEALNLRHAVFDAAQGRRDELGCSPEELSTLAASFAARMRVHPVRSLHEIRALFEVGGFEIERLSSGRLGAGGAGLSGPAVSQCVEYAEVMARR